MHNSHLSAGTSRPTGRRLLQAFLMLFAVVAGALTFSGTAQAHGSVVGPASRAYHCWEEWGNDHMNPAMAQEDPMCWQAYQANPNTMWNWMSMLHEVLVGQFEAPGGDRWGALLQKDSELTPCVSKAIDELRQSGRLETITQKWMGAAAGAPKLQ